jgi:hypothetical protein
MPPLRFELRIPASDGPQAYAVDRAATGIGHLQTFQTYLCSIHIRRPYIGYVAEMYKNSHIVWIKFRALNQNI